MKEKDHEQARTQAPVPQGQLGQPRQPAQRLSRAIAPRTKRRCSRPEVGAASSFVEGRRWSAADIDPDLGDLHHDAFA